MYNPERLHQVRIATKKLRYGLEIAAESGGHGRDAAGPAAQDASRTRSDACTTSRCCSTTSRRSRRSRRRASVPDAEPRARSRGRSKTNAGTCTAATSRWRRRCAAAESTRARQVRRAADPRAGRTAEDDAGQAGTPAQGRGGPPPAATTADATASRGRSVADRMAILELYLIRHGVAAERGDEYPDDSKRPLTTGGHRAAAQGGQGARRARHRASIRSSPARWCARGRRRM